MKKKKTYTGINIQYPISRYIISGEKTIETRTYPLPDKYKNVDLAFIETPGQGGNFKSRIVGLIRFSGCFKYEGRDKFYEDFERHLVSMKSRWAWDGRDKWGWVIDEVRPLDGEIEIKQKKGIVWTSEVSL